jgi:serine/threonine protein phosphatase PrpC
MSENKTRTALRLTAKTDVGRVREHNEDNYVVCPDVEKKEWFFSDTTIESEEGTLLVVADGMGGLNAGFGTTFLEKRERTEWSSTWREGGATFHPFLGVTLPAKKRNWALTASAGYKWQASSFLEGTHSQSETQPKIHPFWTRTTLPEGFNSLNKVSTKYHSLNLQVGILF